MKKLLAIVFMGPFIAFGHEGNGGWHGDLLHQFSSLWHLIPIITIMVGAVWIIRKYLKDRYKNA